MLPNLKNLVKLTGDVIKKCEFQSSFLNEKLSAGRCSACVKNQAKNFHMSTPRNKISKELEYRKAARYEAKREGRVQETFTGDVGLKRKQNYFPTVDLPNTVFGDRAFKDLPIVKIRATRNNTLLALIDQGIAKVTKSCGTEGFKNSRKGTNVAAQTAGTSLGLTAIRRGYKNVRVLIGGLGSGRMSSIKGLQLSGLNVVSITDCTVDVTSLRPRKQRRL